MIYLPRFVIVCLVAVMGACNDGVPVQPGVATPSLRIDTVTIMRLGGSAELGRADCAEVCEILEKSISGAEVPKERHKVAAEIIIRIRAKTEVIGVACYFRSTPIHLEFRGMSVTLSEADSETLRSFIDGLAFKKDDVLR
jgi:hypothetical protein